MNSVNVASISKGLRGSPSLQHRLQSPFSSSDVAEILSWISTRPNYADWIRVISAVGSVLPEDEAYAVLCDWSPEEVKGEYHTKIRRRLTRVGIGSLIAKAKEHGFDAQAFTRRRAERATGRSCNTPSAQPSKVTSAVVPDKRPLRYSMRRGTSEELGMLATLRGLPSIEGLCAMQDAGCLSFTDGLTDKVVPDGDKWKPVTSWLVLDPTRRNVSARRLDGHPWTCLSGAKSRCVSGKGSKSWPIGLSLAKPGQRLDVVEGEGDFLSMWHLHTHAKIRDAAPVGLLTTCADLATVASEIAPNVAGRQIQIFAHRDPNGSGQQAALKWAHAFYSLGAQEVRVRDLTPWLTRGGKDVNDVITSEFNANAAPAAPELFHTA